MSQSERMGRSLDEYMKTPRGKLYERFTLPVDDRFKRIEEAAKAAGLNFNEWARDVLDEKLTELEKLFLPKTA